MLHVKISNVVTLIITWLCSQNCMPQDVSLIITDTIVISKREGITNGTQTGDNTSTLTRCGFSLFVNKVDARIGVTQSIDDNTSWLPKAFWPHRGPKAGNLFGIKGLSLLRASDRGDPYSQRLRGGNQEEKLAYQRRQPNKTNYALL